MKLSKNISIILGLFCSINFSTAQISSNSPLYKMLKTKDSILFDTAFNKCNPMILETMFTKDFEFYYDKDGATSGRDEFLSPIKENCLKRDPNES